MSTAGRALGGKDWIEVGTAAKNGAQGWLPAAAGDRLAPDPHGRLRPHRQSGSGPVLSGSRASLLGLLESEQPGTGDRSACAPRSGPGQIPEGFPVIAKEPDTYVDPNRQFYLLPILASSRSIWRAGTTATLLNVAAVTLQAGEHDLLAPKRGRAARPAAARPPVPARGGVRRLPRRGGLRDRHHDLHGSLHRPHPRRRPPHLRPAQGLLHGRLP